MTVHKDSSQHHPSDDKAAFRGGILINAEDIEWPIALNLFDVSIDETQSYSLANREGFRNAVLALYRSYQLIPPKDHEAGQSYRGEMAAQHFKQYSKPLKLRGAGILEPSLAVLADGLFDFRVPLIHLEVAAEICTGR